MVDQAWYYDGILIKTLGMRLVEMPIGELLSFTWAHIYEEANEQSRRKLELFARGRLGPDGGEIMDDPMLPPSLQGREAPEWFTLDEDPTSDVW